MLAALGDLVWPAHCGGCAQPGARWCPDCAAALGGGAFAGGPRAVRPCPSPPGLPPVVAWGPYADPVRSVMVAYKDRQRPDLAAVLAPLLADVLTAGLSWGPGAWESGPQTWYVVPVPSSPAAVRRRGDRPLERLGKAATRAVAARPGSARVAWAPALATTRTVGDQAGLGHAQRAHNLAGAFDVLPRWAPVVAGAHCVVIDDVVTTGATLTDAARALRVAGVSAVWCATVAATQRRVG
ncbi:MAG: ComF family protein [Austwickia sp.]|nr:ComF family protein [Austwickia sp.]MBK8435893.1 ComF family protein [Austwickia sp.]MBK9101579.1 ComF family protein [Austwickia sp.]